MSDTPAVIDPGETPSLPVACEELGGVFYQKIKLIDPTVGSTSGIGTLTNPIRIDPTGETSQPVTFETSSSAIEGVKSIGSTSSAILAANPSRRRGWIKNVGAQSIYLSFSITALYNSDPVLASPRLEPGEAISIDGYTGPISGIVRSSTCIVQFVEF